MSDLRGQAFTVTETTIGGKKAVLFSGSFTGSTVGGYGFTQMRGAMIEVTADLSIELNHFAPNGVTTDFAADDTLFDQILQQVKFGSTVPIVISPTKTPSASPSGY